MGPLPCKVQHPCLTQRAVLPSSRSGLAGARLPVSAPHQHRPDLRRGAHAPCAASAGESWSRALSNGAARALRFLQQGQQAPAQQQQQQQSQPLQQSEDEAPTTSGTEAAAELVSESVSGLTFSSTDAAEAEAAGHAEPAAAAEPPQTPEDAEWQEWKQYMENILEEAREASDIDDELAQAVEEERYVDAAAWKRELDRFAESDIMYNTVQELDTALEEERYGDAAKLRDVAGTNFVGWWVGRGEGDATGHLLRVSQAYNRFVGQCYLPKDLAEVKTAVANGQANEDEAEDMLDNLGTPLYELFLRRGPDGEIQRRLAAMRGQPVLTESNLEQQLTDSLAALSDGEGIIKVDSEGPDGSMRVTVDLSGTGSGSSPAEDPSQSTSDFPSPEELLGFKSASPPEGFEVLSGGEGDSMDPFSIGPEGLGRSEVQAAVTPDGIQIMSQSTSILKLDRVPAELRNLTRESFSVHIQAPPEDTVVPVADGNASADEQPAEDRSTVAVVKYDPQGAEAVDEETKKKEVDLEKLKAALSTLAAAAQAKGGSLAASRDEIAQLLSGVAQQIDSEPSVPDMLSLSGTYNYWRLPTDLPATDPFNGLYMASYGEHGPELLRVYRETIDGEEWVTCQKLTGDSNVPAGEVTFKAKVGRRHRLDHREMYPPEFAVNMRYKAEGQIAGQGFSNKRWVPGELLVFSGNGPLTNGATLGFLWSIPGHRQFLIPLYRCNLMEP